MFFENFIFENLFLLSHFLDGKGLSTNTLYIIIAAISCITILLLIVISTLLCRSRRNGGYLGNARKKGYTAAATSPGGKTGKGCGRELKPPDLWIHHDQLELKSVEKTQNIDSTLIMTPLPRGSHDIHDDILDKNKKSSTYALYDDINKGSTSPTDTSLSIVSGTSTARRTGRAKPIMIPVDSQQSLQQNGGISFEPSTGLSRPLYPRTQFNIPRAHVNLETGDGSNHQHHLYDPVTGPTVHMGIGNSTSLGAGQLSSNNITYSTASPNIIHQEATSPTSSSMNKRPLGQHPLKSFSVPAPPPQNTPCSSQPKHMGMI